MNEKEKQEIKEMTETAKYLADNDPYGLYLAKNNMNILKARCDLVRAEAQGVKTGRGRISAEEPTGRG